MKQTYTTQLFWKQYAYKVVLRDKINKQTLGLHWMSPRVLRRWFLDNKIANKLVWDTDWDAFFKGQDSQCSVRIYLKTAVDYDFVIKSFNQHVVETSKPYNESHIDLLKSNASVRIKPKLIYGKFRYVVVFRSYLGQEDTDKLSDWVEHSLDLQNTDAVKWMLYSWGTNDVTWYHSPRLYLRDESDVIMVRIAWEEKIKQILVVLLQHEVDGSNLEIP